jgi:CarD family transcriptional regulator
MFLIGEIVFYPVFGAGQIINIEEKEICDEIKKYYIIKLIVNDMDIMIPMESNEAKKLRRAISIEECELVYSTFKMEPIDLPSKWSERYNYYNQSIRRGDIILLASNLRDISALSKKKNLSKSEINVFKEIIGFVCGELALVLRKSYRDTINEVIAILKMTKYWR